MKHFTLYIEIFITVGTRRGETTLGYCKTLIRKLNHVALEPHSRDFFSQLHYVTGT